MSNRVPVSQVIQSWALSVQQTDSKEDTRVSINWDKLKLRLINHKWDKVGRNITSSQLLSNCNYRNQTSEPTKHRIKLTKQTEASCTTTVHEGQTLGCEVLLEIQLPTELTSRTPAFGNFLNVSTEVASSKITSINWVIDTEVSIPPGGVTNAKVVVTNQNFTVGFQGSARLEGYVSVNILSKTTGQCMSTFGGNVTDIFQWYVRKNELRSPSVDSQGVTWLLKGLCTFQFGIQYDVTLSPTAVDVNQISDPQCVIS